MPDITVHPGRLLSVSSACDSTVLAQVDVAKDAFADAEGKPGAARMSAMQAADAATVCIATWQQAFEDASRVMDALSGKIRRTAAVTSTTDVDVVDIFTGPTRDLPTVTLPIFNPVE
ncbi:MAG: hypothetical protein GEV10_22810 [Streptosporangiales bacterium]|nr:hypothetical protein [Streptosporangiales bacterium]